MKKLLLMLVALFTMGTMAVYADYQLDLTTASYGMWNDADSYEINADGSVTMTFTGEWHGTGWQNWSNPWDLTQYESVVVEYTDLEGTDGNEEHPWIQLYIGSDPAIGQGDWSQTGRIEFVMADNATDDDGEPIDYSSVGQIMIQPNGALKVTITSVTFVGGNDADHSGNDYDELPLDNDDDLNAGWNTTYDGATHTITLTGDWGGRGWWLDGDYSAYKGVEVVFTCQNSSYIQLQVEYNEGSGTDGVNANGSEQTLYVEFDQEAAKELKQIYVQGESTGDEIVLVSAKLIKESSGDEGDGDSKFECDGLYYEVLYEDVTDDEGNVVGTTPTDNVQIISPEAYEEGLGVYTITKLSIPATATNGSKTYNVTRIGTSAFASSAVEDLVTIPANIVSTGTSSFDSCNGIIRVTFEEGADLYDDNDSDGKGGWMFGNCPHIDIVHLNRDIYCGSNTRLCAPFTYNTSITTIFIGENVTRVPAYMFRNTSNGALTTVTIYAETPIDWRYDPFSNKTGNKIPTLYVHEDAIEAYEAAAGIDGVAYTDIFEQILPIEGVAEGITNVEAETSAKVTGIYNLAGQRVSENAKGIVIKDGKKVLVK